MNLKTVITVLAVSALIQSCKKSGDITPDDPTVTGNTDGNYLVKAVNITGNGTDTNIVELKWNAVNKLSQYKSSGRSNGFPVEAVYDFYRNAAGNITKVKQVPFGIVSGFDSVISVVRYVSNSTKLLNVVSTSYSSFFDMKDSTTFSYNTANKVVTKTVYAESFFSTGYELSRKETNTYDAAGNITKLVASVYSGGVLSQTSTGTYTYDSHKAVAVIGDEAFIVPLQGAISPNNMIKSVQSYTASGETATTTTTLSQLSFNSFDRLYKCNLTSTLVAPNNNQTITGVLTYFYQ